MPDLGAGSRDVAGRGSADFTPAAAAVPLALPRLDAALSRLAELTPAAAAAPLARPRLDAALSRLAGVLVTDGLCNRLVGAGTEVFDALVGTFAALGRSTPGAGAARFEVTALVLLADARTVPVGRRGTAGGGMVEVPGGGRWTPRTGGRTLEVVVCAFERRRTGGFVCACAGAGTGPRARDNEGRRTPVEDVVLALEVGRELGTEDGAEVAQEEAEVAELEAEDVRSCCAFQVFFARRSADGAVGALKRIGRLA